MSTMPKPDEMPRLAQLASEVPARRLGLIRHLWPSIRVCLDAGHSVRAIQARLGADGVPIPYSTLCWAIANLRRAGTVNQRPAPPKAGEKAANGLVGDDPLANLRRATLNRPGFEYSGTMSDEELFGKK
jgi:hypothetical protein